MTLQAQFLTIYFAFSQCWSSRIAVAPAQQTTFKGNTCSMKTVVLPWLLAAILFPPTPFLQLSSFWFDTLMFFLKIKKKKQTENVVNSSPLNNVRATAFFFFSQLCLFSAVLGQVLSFYTCPTLWKASLGLYKDKRGWNSVLKTLCGCWQCVRREEPSASQTPN